MFRVGDIVRVKLFPHIWGTIHEVSDDGTNFAIKSPRYKPTFIALEEEIELAPLEALADA
jgi:hypothetical protein